MSCRRWWRLVFGAGRGREGNRAAHMILMNIPLRWVTLKCYFIEKQYINRSLCRRNRDYVPCDGINAKDFLYCQLQNTLEKAWPQKNLTPTPQSRPEYLKHLERSSSMLKFHQFLFGIKINGFIRVRSRIRVIRSIWLGLSAKLMLISRSTLRRAQRFFLIFWPSLLWCFAIGNKPSCIRPLLVHALPMCT